MARPVPKSQLALPSLGRRIQMTESIDLTIQSLLAYGADHDHYAAAWSYGKDSTTVITLLVYLILSGKIHAPKTLTVLQADTRQELLPLWLSGESIKEELWDKADDLAALGCKLDVRTVMAPLDKRFLPYILGRGVPPPNNNTLRFCTRQLKVDPMQEELRRLNLDLDGQKVLMLTGVRLGESAVRDTRIALSCSRNDGECGQGWYQRDLSENGICDTLAPILHWRVCHVWEFLKHWAPLPEFGDWTTELLAEAYGGDEAEESQARTGCNGCPLATRDTALDGVLKMHKWAYLAPLKELRPIYRELREPPVRLRKRAGERRKDGSLVSNQQRMGPIVLEKRLEVLNRILDIQRRINTEADRLGRPHVDILNAEEEARIRELIAAKTWPNKWTGDEPRGDEPFEPVYHDGTAQPFLLDVDHADDVEAGDVVDGLPMDEEAMFGG